MLKLQFSKAHLKEVWRFAAGMTSISLVTFFITQIDKVVMSKILSLSQFAYYTLAFTAASSISMIVAPISLSVFPKLTVLVANKDKIGLVKIYHRASKLVATIIFPVGLVLIFFAPEVMFLWTKNLTIVENTTLIVRVLVAGFIFNSLIYIPYNLLVAHGKTKFLFYQNLIAAFILVPLLFWWVHLYGILGGTLVWLALNTAYLLISIPLIHHKLMKGELKTWYVNDTLIPMITPLFTLVIIKFVISYYPILHPHKMIGIGVVSLIVAAISAWSNFETRNWIKKKLLRYGHE